MAECIRHLAERAFWKVVLSCSLSIELAAWIWRAVDPFDYDFPESPSGAGASRHAGHRGGV